MKIVRLMILIAKWKEIENLEGLSHLTQLQTLWIAKNKIHSLLGYLDNNKNITVCTFFIIYLFEVNTNGSEQRR